MRTEGADARDVLDPESASTGHAGRLGHRGEGALAGSRRWTPPVAGSDGGGAARFAFDGRSIVVTWIRRGHLRSSPSPLGRARIRTPLLSFAATTRASGTQRARSRPSTTSIGDGSEGGARAWGSEASEVGCDTGNATRSRTQRSSCGSFAAWRHWWPGSRVERRAASLERPRRLR
jgi:hypothetical protein